jgi:ubiquinone/menaquinone biosynthesis C-methylase UbiE
MRGSPRRWPTCFDDLRGSLSAAKLPNRFGIGSVNEYPSPEPEQSPMTMTVTADRPDPGRLMQMSWSFAAPLVVEAGVRIGLFDLLEGEPRTIKQTAAATGTSARGLAVLMYTLAGLELLHRDETGRFGLTPESAAFLVSSKPEANLGRIFSHISTQLIPAWLDLVQVVRTGRPATGRKNLPEEGAFFASFVESILPLGWPAASALAEHLRIEEAENEPSVLDIGAGSGVYSIPFALRSPKVRITAVDLPEVLKVTQQIAERYGIGDRLKTVAGDMAQVDFGSGHRVATIGQILHSHDEVSNRALLKKTYAALAPGGVVAIAEFLVKPDRSGPLMGLIFAANMLVNTEAGSTYSFEEVHGWLRDAGFEQVRTFDVPGPTSLILATRPR